MRILFCNKYNFRFSGTEVYMFEVMELLRAEGHHVALFSMADSRGEQTAYDDMFVPHTDFKKEASPLEAVKLGLRAIYSDDARVRLRRMIKTFQPDVAHVRNIYHHLSPSILWELREQRVPVLYHINDFKMLCPSYNMVAQGKSCDRCSGGKFRHVITQKCYDGGLGAKLLLAAEAYVHDFAGTYRKCVDRFLAPSQFVKTKLVENGWPSHAIDVLPHFQRVAGQPPAVPGDDSTILYFGRLSPEKGVSDLIHSLRDLPHIHLQIAGDGPSRAALQELAAGLGMQNVHFLGHLQRPQLDRVISAARFTVLPSLAYETFGKSILESYALSRPVIASDLGSRRELIKPGVTGLLFPPGDTRQLASSIAYLHQHPELADGMGAAGLELVRTKYQPDSHCQELLNVYRRTSAASRRTEIKPEIQASQPLKVAFIGGRGVIGKYSGIETYYEEVGARLAKSGHQVTVYCRNRFTPPVPEHHGMRVVRLPAPVSKHFETVLHTLFSTFHATFGPQQIVHYQCLGPALFSFIPRLAGKKTVVTVQGLDWQRKKWGWFAAKTLQLGELASLRLPNATMVVSQTLQRHFRGAHFTDTFYVPNGTVLRQIRKPEQILRLGLSPHDYILFLGRFSPEKNCHLLIEAYEKLNTTTHLVLAGGSSHTDEYAACIRRRRSERVHILDWVSGELLEELLTNAMIFVLPSDLEGLSLALLDAMGAGVCAVASAISENIELIGGGAGFTFAPGDANDLARLLQKLISAPEQRQQAIDVARENIRINYQWDKVAAQVADVYRTVLDGKTTRPILLHAPPAPLSAALSPPEKPPQAA